MKYTFVVIYQDVTEEFGITVDQHFIASLIQVLSGKKSKFPGWCYMSKVNMGKVIGRSSSTVNTIINKLEDKQLVRRKFVRSKLIQPTEKWLKMLDSVKKNERKQSVKIGDNSNKHKKRNKGGLSSTKKEGGTDNTSVVTQSFVELYKTHIGIEPIVNYSDTQKIKSTLKYLTVEQLIDYLESRVDNGNIPLNDALNLSFALSSGALNKWRDEMGIG